MNVVKIFFVLMSSAMEDLFYKREVLRVQAWLKLGIGRLLSSLVKACSFQRDPYYERIIMHKMPPQETLQDTKKWKIDLKKVDPQFAYRMDQAKLGASKKFHRLPGQRLRRVFRWHLQETDSLALKNLKKLQNHEGSCHHYTCFSGECSQPQDMQEYQRENRRSLEPKLFQVDKHS